MGKKPTDSLENQTSANDSVLYRLWNHFKDKKSSESVEESLHDVQPAAPSIEGPAPLTLQEVQPANDSIGEEVPPTEASANINTGEELPAEDQLLEQNLEAVDSESDEPEEEKIPVDASLELTISQDRMTATGIVSPPENGGADITEEIVFNALKEKGIQEQFFASCVKMLCKFKLYGKSAVLANGIPAKDGANGYVEELFERETNIHLETDENDLVNFKNLNKFQIVKKGTVICRIFPPEPAEDGLNLFGEVVTGTPGVPAKVSLGKNTELSEDETELIASCDGNLRYNDKFFVEDILRIQGDVDNAFGNLDFCGDIVIDGCVREGFSVRSDKNITIKGAVEGALIIANQNITLQKGMNGMGHGLLKAGGDIKGRFLENCTVTAGGTVKAEAIINCHVTSEDEILVEGGKGVIVGGTCMARNAIKAKNIGSSACVSTTIMLGISSETLEQKKQITQKVHELQEKLDKLKRDCSYLENMSKRVTLPPERAAQLERFKKEQMLCSVQINIDSKRLFEIDELIESLTGCSLSCYQIYPPVKLIMANESLIIKNRETNRRYYYNEGEIKAGTL